MALALCYPNKFADASVYGQGWTSGLPLSNLLTRQISQVARGLFGKERFFAQLPSGSLTSVIALVGHGLSTSDDVRVRAYSSDPRTEVDKHTDTATIDLRWAEWMAAPSQGTLACSRSSSAYYFDSAGVLQSASSNVVRFTYDQSTAKANGLMVEGQSTNVLLWCRDLTNAAWTKTNLTTAKTATGIDGVSNSATRITATATNARVTRAWSTGGTATSVVSAYVKRISGSGALRMTADNFGASTTITPSGSGWERKQVQISASSGTFGIEVATSGDVFEIDFCQAENSLNATSPILTTTASATRNGDTITFTLPTTMQPSLATCSWVWQGRSISPTSVAATTSPLAKIANSGATTYSAIRCQADASNTVVSARYYTSATDNTTGLPSSAISHGPSAGSYFAAAVSVSSGLHRFAVNGQYDSGTYGAVATASQTATQVIFETQPGQSYTVERLTIFPLTFSALQVQALDAYASEPAAAYDSGLVDAWPAAWVADTSSDQQDGVRGLTIIDTGSRTELWWRVDLLSSESYVELGRMFTGQKWRPQYGAASGASLGYRDRSSFIEAYDGARYFIEVRCPKVARFNLEGQTREAVMRYVLDIQRRQGSTREVLFMLDDQDSTYLMETAFLGTLKQLAPPVAISANLWSAQVELEELL